MKANAYAYEVGPMGHIRERTADAGWRIAGSTYLDGVQTSLIWPGPFARSSRDLLRVAAAVLYADRLSLRRRPGSKETLQELQWQRDIELRIAVENPARWSTAAGTLETLLGSMTDDRWSFRFDDAHSASVQLPLFPVENGPIGEVALFSGGLDSIAGMYARNSRAQGTFVAVSACGNDVRGRAQREALATLRDLGVRAAWVKFAHQLRGTRRGRWAMEASQRSRGLLFLAMGAVVASALGAEKVHVYETGVGCINLPLSPAQVASQGTRAMHPRTLADAEALFSLVLDDPVRIVAPFFFQTKGELCRETGLALERLAAVAMSCDEGEGHKPDAMGHCGVCTSCIFRRVALRSAAPEVDKTRYRDVPTRRHGEYELLTFEHHATQLSACARFEDLLELDPDIRFALRAPVERRLTEAETKQELLAMYSRYSRELRSFFSSARPKLRPRLQAARKENSRGLFAAAR